MSPAIIKVEFSALRGRKPPDQSNFKFLNHSDPSGTWTERRTRSVIALIGGGSWPEAPKDRLNRAYVVTSVREVMIDVMPIVDFEGTLPIGGASSETEG